MSLEDIIKFAINPEPRCPVILLLDTSNSMSGEAINELNAGVAIFKQEVQQDAKASLRVEVAIITFGGKPQVVQDFVTVNEFISKKLTTSGNTPMGEAIELALNQLEARKIKYKESGIQYYQPWCFLISDGAPTDTWQNAAQRVREAAANRKLSFFTVGVKNADINILGQIAPINTPPVKLDGLKFQELFRWLSASVKGVSHSQPGDQVELSPITGWGKINA